MSVALRVLLVCVLLLEFSADGAAVRYGNEVMVDRGFKELKGKKIGLLTNPSGVSSRLERTADILHRAVECDLVALFAAEHGLYGDVPAGVEFKDMVDARTQKPVYSLYGPGPVRKPTPAMLAGLDALVYDIQDTGCRSYTFISSMGMAMEACAEAGVEFIVLDRPNPLGGLQVEGPVLKTKYRSMVGQWPIPYVYGMTSGELARMINGEGWIKKPCRLTIIAMQGWKRSMSWRETGLPWVPTSPYIPHADSPMHYVSTGILGQIGGVSIGIGYTLPFQCVAAPWLDGQALSDALNGYRLSGVKFIPVTYKPFYGAFSGKVISGVQVHFIEPATAPLMAINFYAMEAVRKVGGRNLFAEAMKNERDFTFFDKVNGTDATRRMLEAGKPAASIVESWKEDEAEFRRARAKYLIY